MIEGLKTSLTKKELIEEFEKMERGDVLTQTDYYEFIFSIIKLLPEPEEVVTGYEIKEL